MINSVVRRPSRMPIKFPLSPARAHEPNFIAAPVAIREITLPGFEYPTVDVNTPVDLLFDVVFDTSANFGKVGVYQNDPNTPGATGEIVSLIPSSFLEDGAYELEGNTYFQGGVCVYSSPSYGTYAYFSNLVPAMQSVDVTENAVARLYHHDFLVSSSFTPQIADPSGEPPALRVQFNNFEDELVEGERYRIRVWDKEPDPDMQMLFEVKGIAVVIPGNAGRVGVNWFNPNNVSNSYVEFGENVTINPDDFVMPDSGGPQNHTGYVSSGSFTYEGTVYAGTNVGVYTNESLVSNLNGVDVQIRLYGDTGTLIGTQVAQFGSGIENTSYVKSYFEGAVLSEGDNCKLRIWAPTDAFEAPPSLPVDSNLLFDLDFVAGDGSIETTHGFWQGPTSAPPVAGSVNSIFPVDFADEDDRANMCCYTTSADGTYAFITHHQSNMDEWGLDTDTVPHGRIYWRNHLIGSGIADTPYLDSYDSEDLLVMQKVSFTDITDAIATDDQYRVRFWQHEPPVDEQMLFEVRGTAADIEGVGVGFNWFGTDLYEAFTQRGTIIHRIPDDMLPTPATGLIGGELFQGEYGPIAQFSTSYASIPGFAWGYANARIALYNDTECLGQTTSTFGINGQTLSLSSSPTFEGVTLAGGQNYKLRIWVSTSSIGQPDRPYPTSPAGFSGMIAAGAEVNIVDGTWGGLGGVPAHDGMVDWFINSQADGNGTNFVTSVNLPLGTPYELPAGCEGYFLGAIVYKSSAATPGSNYGIFELFPGVLIESLVE